MHSAMMRLKATALHRRAGRTADPRMFAEGAADQAQGRIGLLIVDYHGSWSAAARTKPGNIRHLGRAPLAKELRIPVIAFAADLARPRSSGNKRR